MIGAYFAILICGDYGKAQIAKTTPGRWRENRADCIRYPRYGMGNKLVKPLFKSPFKSMESIESGRVGGYQ